MSTLPTIKKTVNPIMCTPLSKYDHADLQCTITSLVCIVSLKHYVQGYKHDYWYMFWLLEYHNRVDNDGVSLHPNSTLSFYLTPLSMTL